MIDGSVLLEIEAVSSVLVDDKTVFVSEVLSTKIRFVDD
jgi:hypothetical protein